MSDLAPVEKFAAGNNIKIHAVALYLLWLIILVNDNYFYLTFFWRTFNFLLVYLPLGWRSEIFGSEIARSFG